MSNYPVGRRPRSADPHTTLRLAALTAVVAGVVLLAAAAFVLSYPGIHSVALRAGVSPDLAKLYPVIFDAMLVVAGAAAMALRGAGWWSRFYAWACLIALLAAVAIGDAVHATGTALPERATRAAVAVTPWVLLLLAFGLLLTMLRHFRKSRAAVVARQEARAAAAVDTGNQPAQGNGTVSGRAPVTWATAGTAAIAAGAASTAAAPAGPAVSAVGAAVAPADSAAGAAGTATATEARPLPPQRFGLDFWLGPRQSQAPVIEAPYEAGLADTGEDVSHSDPVSYGEETGYVHPDSYRDEGEYSPHGDSGGPGTYTGSGASGRGDPAGHSDATPQQPQRGTAESNGEGTGIAAAAAQADKADAAEADKAEAAAQEGKADVAAQESKADVAAQEGGADATAQADKADAAGADRAEAAAQESKADVAAQADVAMQEGKADAVAQAGKDATAQAGKAKEGKADGGQAGEPARDDASGEKVAAQGPGLKRVRSTPTRPEE
jgi:Protein of unknown function (DUF2637)